MGGWGLGTRSVRWSPGSSDGAPGLQTRGAAFGTDHARAFRPRGADGRGTGRSSRIDCHCKADAMSQPTDVDGIRSDTRRRSVVALRRPPPLHVRNACAHRRLRRCALVRDARQAIVLQDPRAAAPPRVPCHARCRAAMTAGTTGARESVELFGESSASLFSRMRRCPPSPCAAPWMPRPPD